MKKVFIDVREPHEFASGHVDGALNIPLSRLTDGAAELEGTPRDAELVVYCLSGGRASAAVSALIHMGYTNVVNGINTERIRDQYGA